MKVEMISVSCHQKKVGDGKEAKMEKLAKPIEGSVPYNMPETLEEAAELFGKDVATNMLLGKARIFVQDTWRRLVSTGTDPDKATELAKVAKPGTVTRAPVDPKAAATSALATMSKEERMAFIKELQKQAASM